VAHALHRLIRELDRDDVVGDEQRGFAAHRVDREARVTRVVPRAPMRGGGAAGEIGGAGFPLVLVGQREAGGQHGESENDEPGRFHGHTPGEGVKRRHTA